MKKYYLLAFTFAIICGQSLTFGQSDNLQKNSKTKTDFMLELSVVEKSMEPNTSLVHTYLLQVDNKFDKPLSVKVLTDNITCYENKRVNVNLLQNIYQNESENSLLNSNNSTTVTVEAKSVLIFYVTLTRPSGTILNSWNCTQVKAVDNAGVVISNSILLETYIPNPKDFR